MVNKLKELDEVLEEIKLHELASFQFGGGDAEKIRLVKALEFAIEHLYSGDKKQILKILGVKP